MSTTLSKISLPESSYQASDYKGLSFDEVSALRKKYLTPSLLTYYQKPLMIVEGKMQYLWDDKGRRYLDGFAGIVTVSVGHCHPKVNAAIMEQMQKLQHTTNIYLNPAIAEYAEALASRMPDGLEVCYFCNSGSEANDLAMLMARAYTKNYDILALRNCYHGGSNSTMGLTAHQNWKFNVPHNHGVHHAMNPNPYRGTWGWDDPDAGAKYAYDVKDLIQHGTSGKIAGFFSETMQGVGGTVVYPHDYLQHAYKHVREAGGLCIADEVQTAFGRTGTHYWGFETQGVVPDIVTLAKGIGNGIPLAAVVTRPEIAQAMTTRTHFNTYGGNPISCVAGKAVLEVIDEEKLQENALIVGNYLITELKKLQDRHNIIGDVRGSGLMIGVELVKDRDSKEPASEACAQVFELAKDQGLLIGKGGLFGNCLRIKPPLCISMKDAEFMVSVLDSCFQSL
ncbi:MAG: aspartate aminotransferase family protein [Waddliaceae bacterium]|nr:aspartate aminotransferase family protein [Waddliaceae bacterium]